MEPELIIALITLIGMEVVLGIDNLIFIAILSNRLPPEQRQLARRIGLSMAVIMRFGMLAGAAWLLSLTLPLFTIFGMGISGKDIILIGGGLFLIGKATIEIHHRVIAHEHPAPAASTGEGVSTAAVAGRAVATFWPTVFQILLLDMVFSVDSIIVAVGMVNVMWIIVVAICVAVAAMMLSMDALSNFIERNPTVVMLALAFLVMIGMVLVAEGFEVKVPKAFVYTAMAFSAVVEGLNILARRRSGAAH